MARRSLLPLCLLFLALAPGAASAATVAPGPGGTMMVGGTSGVNEVTVSLAGGTFTITDTEGMNPSPPCMSADANTATCPAASFASLTIDLEAGDDTYSSTAPTPATVHGGPGRDTITAGAGDDDMDGGTGPDTMDGGAGDDTVNGSPLDAAVDTLSGGDGKDMVVGNAGDDVMQGGPGDDDIQGGGDQDTANGGEGDDAITGGAGRDVVFGGPGNDRVDGSVPGLVGQDEADALAGGEGDDSVAGGDGDDTMNGGPGADDVGGGPGTDTASYVEATRALKVTLDGKPDDGESGEGDNVQPDVENVSDGPGNDTFTGSDAPNGLVMGAGEDYADGAGGVDELTGGDDRDVLRARDGLADIVKCGPGVDFAILDSIDTARSECERFDTPRLHKPRLRRRIVLRPLRTGERFRVKGSHRFVPLKDTIGVPLGWRIDATRGRVKVTSARLGGGSQSATFSGGGFVALQRRSGRGLTELKLAGGDLSKCNAKAGAAGRRSRRTFRRLFGRTRRGRFRTRGRYSTATVRGTQWTVADRCDGTLTTVRRGRVVVRDLVRGKTIVLHKGQRYLARRGHG